ncbi:hypothetical protein KBC99_03275 [Candidatus Saccharibacteria bacterium]|nr:hypothetical protein [Candidatus Saccharibacteria bacterium]
MIHKPHILHIPLLIAIFIALAGLSYGYYSNSFSLTGIATLLNRSATRPVVVEEKGIRFSSQSELPNNFPSDIAIYPGATVSYSLVDKNNNITVTLQSGDSIEKIEAYYIQALSTQGWSKDQNHSSYFESQSALATKNGRLLQIELSPATPGQPKLTKILITQKS